jgi:hypothetical protein
MSVTRALALANETVMAQGIKPAESSVTITEEPTANGGSWRIHYRPRDYIGRQGGDFIVFVDGRGEIVQRTLRGQ